MDSDDNVGIRLVAEYIDYGYQELSNIRVLTKQEKDDGDSWKSSEDENPEIEHLRNRGGIQLGPVELYYPLDKGVVHVRRHVDLLVSSFTIINERKKSFSGLTDLLVPRTNGLKYNSNEMFFSPTSDEGTGYLCYGEGNDIERVLSVASIGMKNRTRGLFIGDFGSKPSDFDDINYNRDLRLLLDFSTLYLRACYDNLLRFKRIKEVPTGPLYLNP